MKAYEQKPPPVPYLFKMGTFAVIVYTFCQLAGIAHSAESSLGGIVGDLLGGSVDDGCPAVDPIDHFVFLPNAENCNQFYECSMGHAKLFTCPDGLQFDIKMQVCNWPENVDCGTRQ